MNIVTATFSAGCTQIDADRKLWQYDQGQVLQLVGLDLPDAYQVEFSNTRDKGSAKAQIGGPDGVQIPDEYLTTGKPVYAFLVGHTAEEDRETEKLVVIYVNARSQPTDEPITPEQQNIVDQLIAALTAGVEKAEDAAAQAEAAISFMPKIVDGTWWVYDAETETWADTGIQAEGQDGVGISGAVLNADYTLTLTFTDGSSYTTPSIRGAQGERGPIGPTPDISIGTVTTGAAGSQAEATMTGTPERPVLNLTIPRGDPGEVTQAEFDALADEVADQKSAIDDLTALTNRKAGALIDTASGSIASFVPDSTIENLLGLSVDIEPVQDLHGYDSPWPAGGGKNKFFPPDAPITIDGVTVEGTSDGEIWVHGTPAFASGYKSFNLGTLPESLEGETVSLSISEKIAGFGIVIGSNNGNLNLTMSDTVTSRSGVYTAGGNRACYINIRYDIGTVDKKFKIQLEVNATPTAWAPYSNLCPISGWNSVEVEADGVNLFGGEVSQLAFTGSIYSAKIVSNASYRAIFARVKSGKTYTVSRKTIEGNRFRVAATVDYPASEVQCKLLANDSQQDTALTVTVTIPDGYNYIFVYLSNQSDDCTAGNYQIELGSTASSYHPFAGSTYTITLGQTVYGGTLTIAEGGSVEMLADRVFFEKTFGAMATAAQTAPAGYVVKSSGLLPRSGNASRPSEMLCNVAKQYQSAIANSFRMSSTGNYMFFCLPEDTDSSLTVTAVYPIATPIVITLDPVTISTISGQPNNVWADAGNVSVEFAADLKAYIDSKIAAAVAALS